MIDFKITPAPTNCYFILTENCNLRCTYCFERNTREVSKYMSKETAFKTIDYLFKNAQLRKDAQCESGKCNCRPVSIGITFFGGEPLLCPELMTDILHYGQSKEEETGIPINFSLITNGTLYNDKIEAFLEEWYRIKRTIDIQLSIDGGPDIQNLNRPCANVCIKSSDLVESAVIKYKQFIEKHNIASDKLHVHCVISKSSLPYIYDSHLYFTRQLKLFYKFAWVIEDNWDDEDVKILDEQLQRIMSHVRSFSTNKNRFPFKTFDKCSGCSSGRNLICVDTNGDIYPCHRFFFYSEKRINMRYGNIYNEQPINLELYQKFTSIDESKISDKPCQVCIAVNYEYTDDLHKRVHDYDEKFMVVLNRQYYDFLNFIERKNIAKTLEHLVHENKKLSDRITLLEEKLNIKP
ncbi:MAG: radical SAM protein [Bacilli bacterium]|nr:radical SAM protein [Bacilli bacterium]